MTILRNVFKKSPVNRIIFFKIANRDTMAHIVYYTALLVPLVTNVAAVVFPYVRMKNVIMSLDVKRKPRLQLPLQV